MCFAAGWNINNFISPWVSGFGLCCCWPNCEYTKVANFNSSDFIVFTQHLAHCFKDSVDKLVRLIISCHQFGGYTLGDVFFYISLAFYSNNKYYILIRAISLFLNSTIKCNSTALIEEQAVVGFVLLIHSKMNIR